jgi:YD repeat-containing protein
MSHSIRAIRIHIKRIHLRGIHLRGIQILEHYKLIFIIFLFLQILRITARANTDMRTASWSQTMVDFKRGSFAIDRTYNSRSRHIGFFGFGWCSPFEARLQAKLEFASVDDCGIVRRFKRDLMTGAFRPLDQGEARLSNEGDSWVLRIRDSSVRRFDKHGRLISITQPGKIETRLIYDTRGLLREAATGEGLRMRFEFDPISGRVISISSHPESADPPVRILYEYDKNDLRRITNAWNNVYLFAYDPLHNLLRIEYPDRTFEAMSYREDLDQITSYTGRDGCIERYDFRNNPDDPSLRFDSFASKSCHGFLIGRTRFEFHHTVDKFGNLRVERSIIVRASETIEIQHHPMTGATNQVVIVSKNLNSSLNKGSKHEERHPLHR